MRNVGKALMLAGAALGMGALLLVAFPAPAKVMLPESPEQTVNRAGKSDRLDVRSPTFPNYYWLTRIV